MTLSLGFCLGMGGNKSCSDFNCLVMPLFIITTLILMMSETKEKINEIVVAMCLPSMLLRQAL